MSYADRIRNYIVHGYLRGDDSVALDQDTPLLGLNIIDSFAVFDLVDFLRTEFDVRVPLESITPENFQDVRSIMRLVKILQGS